MVRFKYFQNKFFAIFSTYKH
ncbi:hypothetical protein MTBLM1_10195 [Rhodospirillaceae bacterium LM-1]|nr:hypothetical protein MTBLM1_10195 [Rhodospirillaceae bacterium LM-1]